jgi:hypothetical protein
LIDKGAIIFRAIGKNRMDGSIAPLRNAVREPGRSVLHVLPTGAMRNLERFLDAAVEFGVRLRQDFAPERAPILNGRIVRPLADILSPTSAA